MSPHYHPPQPADLPFMYEMLYEAVFWRDTPHKPTLEEGLALPEVSISLLEWGDRHGDTGVMATIAGVRVGAAWYRYWNDTLPVRGYLTPDIPVIVIGVHRDYRRQGVGRGLLLQLIEAAAKQGLAQVSLMVSKDNHALHLYRNVGFVEHRDTGDSLLMVRKV
jgi:ribosomal protein S18 acetylase RimI-like enzyme